LGEVPPPLTRDRRCDVALIGAGVTGALVADALTAAGLSVIVLDRRHPGLGSTSASTALLQYELDASICELSEKLGRSAAVDCYRAALHGVRTIARLAAGLKQDVGFRRRPSLYFASRSRDEKALREEGRERRKAGLPCEILDEKQLRKIVAIDAPVALWSSVGGEIDPWRLTQALLSRCRRRRRIEIYGRTEVERIVPAKGHVEVRSERGVVRASKVVVTAGYESEKFLPAPVASLHSTYAIVTEPVSAFNGWRQRCLLWESARPYLYVRTTPDDRIVVGGADDSFRDPEERDQRVPKKAEKLLARAKKLFPEIELELAYAWAGTFGETGDSLPYIGAHPDHDQRVLYALAYGANGIPYGAVAADLVTAAATRQMHPGAHLFSFARRNK
jgi:glycine/D-amino acid oxidase-like deaminating enzyme